MLCLILSVRSQRTIGIIEHTHTHEIVEPRAKVILSKFSGEVIYRPMRQTLLPMFTWLTYSAAVTVDC